MDEKREKLGGYKLNLYYTYRRRVSLLMAIVLMVQMIFQLFVPVTYAKSVRDTTQLVPVLTVNGQTVNLDDVVELRPGDEVSLQVDYSNKLSDNGLKPGDVLYFKLPKVF